MQMVVLLEIIAASLDSGDKVLVFSQRRPVLDLIERVLTKKGWGGFVQTRGPPSANSRYDDDEGATDGRGEWGPWKNGTHYYRIDGDTNAKTR